ncbi:MAG TPA: ImmA/IrrE family metallo-endopeptidase [Myxococcota bacterium]|nr:ImmA/IrrE family metallo-endopeptidase [Myxococcota bacterium]
MSESPWEEWEGAAAEVIDSTCTSAPVDGFRLAKACGFEVRLHAGRNETRGEIIYINCRMRPQRQHGRLGHELGHYALARHEIPDSEEGARWAGGAMLMPRREADRDITRFAWSVAQLRAKHINVSATAIAVRITQLRDAVATLIDPRGHHKPWRVHSPWISEKRFRRVSSWERELAERAYAEGVEVRGDELCYALPLIDGAVHEHRVLVVCELEQLSLRL